MITGIGAVECKVILNCLALIALAQSTLAGLEIFYDGKKFFFKVNGKEIPLDTSPGVEMVRFQNNLYFPNSRKTRDTYSNINGMGANLEELSDEISDLSPWEESLLDDYEAQYSFNDDDSDWMDLEDEFQDGSDDEEEPTRYDKIISMVAAAGLQNSELVNATLSAIKEDLERNLIKNQRKLSDERKTVSYI